MSTHNHLVHRSLFRPWLLPIALVLLGGCALNPTARTEATNDDALVGVVTRDLLFVMSQLLPPRSTTLQLGKPVTRYGRELENGLREIGYGMQRVDADQGPSYLTYAETTRVSSDNRLTHTFNVYIGDTGLEREYVFVNDTVVVPVGPMRVFGSNVSITLNQVLFGSQADNNDMLSQVEYVDDDQSATEIPRITLITDALIRDILAAEPEQLPSYKSLNFQNIEVENLYSRGSSNFRSADEDYRLVRKDVIVFDDDSLRLLDRGRAQVSRILALYQQQTDLFRLIGCSNGPTQFDGGNEALALGRSKRIALELVNRGVDESAILDEGCWAPVSAGDRFPARGVIIELRRRS